MSRIMPYKGTSQDRLSQLIRDAQHPALTTGVNFNFAAPTVGIIPVPGSTEVMTEAYTTVRHDDAKAISYQRLDFNALKRLPPGELIPFDPMTFPTTMHAILPQINAALGLDLVPDEVVDTPLDSIPVNALTITITENSLAWLAGDYDFTYAPNSIQPAARNTNNTIPTDERRRIRVLEAPIS